MARTLARFSALAISKLAKERSDKTRLHHDGGGLYLIVDRRGQSTSWAYRYMIDGRARMLGLGRYPEITLHQAREQAAEARRLKARGQDPLETKHQTRKSRQAEQARQVTFKTLAEEFIRNKESGWSNPKHGAQWRSTLRTYAFPIIGEMVVGEVDTTAVLRVLRQPMATDDAATLWEARSETASRLRGRIEAVLDYAKVRHLREGDNPAAWRGNLKLALPPKNKVRQVKPHEALSIDAMPAFMRALQAIDTTSARALEFAILTSSRTGETLGAQWSEIDLTAGVWRVPAERMKAGREHRVPLSSPAMVLLQDLGADQGGQAFIFVNSKRQKFSNMALLMLLKRMGHASLTVHGFRSTFRDWVAERTTFPRELAEKALAHTLGAGVEAAYQRSDLLERRRELMEAWATWCFKAEDDRSTSPP